MRIAGYFLLICMISCQTETSWKEVTINSRVSVSLPEGMTLSSEPNPHALAHYEDTMKSVFFILIRESKDTMKTYELDHNLSSYFEQVCRDVTDKLSGASPAIIQAEKISQKDAYMGYTTGTYGSKKIGYVLGGIETDAFFYQLITAYPVEDSVKAKPDLERLIRSFREL